MTALEFLQTIVDPGLEFIEPITNIPISDEARVMLLAIAGQESGWTERRQIGGPARSWWMMERGGGLAQVMEGASTIHACQLMAGEFCIPFVAADLFEACAWHDDLAVGVARLLLWSDPDRLPAIGDNVDAWQCYLRNWRPGRPRIASWPRIYQESVEAVRLMPKSNAIA